jgi:hypothetical protein
MGLRLQRLGEILFSAAGVREWYRNKADARLPGQFKSNGLGNIYLWAFEKNFPARLFYEKNCFPLNGDKISETTGSREIYSARYIYQPARQCPAKTE